MSRQRVTLCLGLFLLAVFVARGQAIFPQLRSPSAIAFDSAGNLYIADASGNQVLEATLGGALIAVAGTGVQGFAGDGGPAASALLSQPKGLAFGADGTLYIADSGNHRVRAVNAAGVVTTFAGSGKAGFSGDGGAAVGAALRGPTSLAVDTSGSLLICDTGNQRVRRVSGAGIISSFAGTGVQGFGGDGGPPQTAQLDSPTGVTVGSDGRVFIADTDNQRVRVVGIDGVIQTFAGTGVRGFAGEGGPAVAALLDHPTGLAWMSDGTLLIADSGNQRVRAVSAAGVINTWSGSGTEGESADGGSAMTAAMRAPRAVAVSSFGLPVAADTLNGTIRELANASQLYRPAALAAGRVSTVTVTGSPTQVYGQTAFSINVAGAVTPAVGTIAMADTGAEPVQGVLSSGALQFSLSSLSAGRHSLTATYAGDGLNPSASSNPMNVVVQPAQVLATALLCDSALWFGASPNLRCADGRSAAG